MALNGDGTRGERGVSKVQIPPPAPVIRLRTVVGGGPVQRWALHACPPGWARRPAGSYTEYREGVEWGGGGGGEDRHMKRERDHEAKESLVTYRTGGGLAQPSGSRDTHGGVVKQKQQHKITTSWAGCWPNSWGCCGTRGTTTARR